MLGAVFAVLLVALRRPLADILIATRAARRARAVAVLTFVGAAMRNTLNPRGRPGISAWLSAVSSAICRLCLSPADDRALRSRARLICLRLRKSPLRAHEGSLASAGSPLEQSFAHGARSLGA